MLHIATENRGRGKFPALGVAKRNLSVQDATGAVRQVIAASDLDCLVLISPCSCTAGRPGGVDRIFNDQA